MAGFEERRGSWFRVFAGVLQAVIEPSLPQDGLAGHRTWRSCLETGSCRNIADATAPNRPSGCQMEGTRPWGALTARPSPPRSAVTGNVA